MKIVHLIYAGLGGHTSVFFAHEKFAAENGIELAVCLYGIEEPLSSTILLLEQKKIPYIFVKKKRGFDFSFANKVAKVVFSFKPDIVFLHSAQSLPWLKVIHFFKHRTKKIRFIVRETQALNLKTIRQKVLSKISLLLADTVVFLSEGYRMDFFSTFPSGKKYIHKTRVIPNGLDIDYFKPLPSSDGERKPIHIGMISRLVAIKDHRTLIDAVLKLRESGYDVILHIAGDGATFNDIQKHILSRKASQAIVMHGLLSGSKIVEFLQSLDIYVHSSLGETMSNSIMQAQSCGLPIVATDVFGINNIIVSGETGYLFPLGDVDELVKILTCMVNDNTLIEKYGKRSRKYAVEHLSDSRMFNEYLEIFKS